MADQTAFVDVRDAFVDYPLKTSFWKLLAARQETHLGLSDITLRLPLGAQVTVFGHSGAGKTTLLRLLTGLVLPSRGTVRVNGRRPHEIRHVASGYVSSEESEPASETGQQVLNAFARTHQISQPSARISAISDVLALSTILHRPARQLSTSQRLQLNLARAAISDTPLILLDDVADQLGTAYLNRIMPPLFSGRAVLVTTRHVATAERLKLPLLLLHSGRLAHHGTLDEIAADLSCPRIVDVWIEGLRYDVLRKLRRHTGVTEARLLPSTQFSGQRLRITLHSARYLPSLYDLVSQAPLLQVRELPPSLNDIIERL